MVPGLTLPDHIIKIQNESKTAAIKQSIERWCCNFSSILRCVSVDPISLSAASFEYEGTVAIFVVFCVTWTFHGKSPT